MLDRDSLRTSLELYSGIILPRLADGPKSLAQLDVPRYAVGHLERAGLVRSKMHSKGCIAVEYWYRPEDYLRRVGTAPTWILLGWMKKRPTRGMKAPLTSRCECVTRISDTN